MSGEGSRPFGPTQSSELVGALCHEVGNWLAAVRLQAHLLDDDLGPRELASASLEIDDLCARSSAMLALLRPLLGERSDSAPAADLAALLPTLRAALVDHGTRQVTLEVEAPDSPRPVRAAHAVLLSLLTTLCWGSVHAMRDGGTLRISSRPPSRPDGDSVVIRLEDGAPFEGRIDDWRSPPLRARALGWAIAESLASGLGGGLDVGEHAGGCRVDLRLPASP